MVRARSTALWFLESAIVKALDIARLPSFRTIQVCPKDWLTLYRQAGRCGEPPATPVAGWYDRRRYSADEGGPCPA
jgi:hypothetical protein